MDRILAFILLILLLALLFFVVIGLCLYGANIIEQHPFYGLFLICIGIVIVPAIIIGGS